MERFKPTTLLTIYYSIQQISGKRNVVDKSNEIIPKNERDKYIKDFELFEYELCRIGLKQSAKIGVRIITNLSKRTVTYGLMKTYGDELHDRLRDEIDDRVFIEIDANKQSLLDGKNLFGVEVTSSFPTTEVDIEEAGKCLALERWTSSVFHLMRVMEVGLHTLGSILKLPATNNRNWESILKKCDDESKKPFDQKSSEWKTNEAFFSEATAMLHSVKNAWRNPTMHVEKVYTEEQAQDIWNAVKSFMMYFAIQLKENRIV